MTSVNIPFELSPMYGLPIAEIELEDGKKAFLIYPRKLTQMDAVRISMAAHRLAHTDFKLEGLAGEEGT